MIKYDSEGEEWLDIYYWKEDTPKFLRIRNKSHIENEKSNRITKYEITNKE